MIRKFLFIAVLAWLPFQFCKRMPNLPEPEPGKRNYVWEVDTLDMPMNYISSVWGASPTSVWAVGGGGTYKDRLQHYDGSTWSAYNKEVIWCTGFTLYGFSADNVWMGGGGGWLEHGAGIWHYDGAKWSQNYVYDVKGSYAIEVDDIWGIYQYDIYASGTIGYYDGKTNVFRGFVLHYNGKGWQEVVRAQFDSQFLTIRAERNKLYIFSVGMVNGRVGMYEFYEIKNHQLLKIYSGPPTLGISLYSIAGNVYFVMGHDVCRYIDGSFVKQFSIDFENFGNQICGRNENDQFIRMTDGIAHYNGVDIEYLFSFPRLSISIKKNAVLFEKEVFFGATSNDRKNLIVHGNLKE